MTTLENWHSCPNDDESPLSPAEQEDADYWNSLFTIADALHGEDNE